MQQKLIAIKSFRPASLAGLIQIVALILVMFIAWFLNWASSVLIANEISIPTLIIVLLQAVIASTLSHWAGMEKWWRWIHFCFPFAIWLMLSLNIPSNFYLIGFVATLGLYWTTFRTQVPFYPSRPMIWQQVCGVISQDRAMRVIDIGSGLGDMAMYLAKERPDCVIEGIEIAPLPWAISFLRGKLRRSTVIFRMGDYRALNFADYDVIFAYLSPAAMSYLWQKAQNEMQSGSLLISYEFEIKEVVPTEVIASEGRDEKLFVWKVNSP